MRRAATRIAELALRPSLLFAIPAGLSVALLAVSTVLLVAVVAEPDDWAMFVSPHFPIPHPAVFVVAAAGAGGLGLLALHALARSESSRLLRPAVLRWLLRGVAVTSAGLVAAAVAIPLPTETEMSHRAVAMAEGGFAWRLRNAIELDLPTATAEVERRLADPDPSWRFLAAALLWRSRPDAPDLVRAIGGAAAEIYGPGFDLDAYVQSHPAGCRRFHEGLDLLRRCGFRLDESEGYFHCDDPVPARECIVVGCFRHWWEQWRATFTTVADADRR